MKKRTGLPLQSVQPQSSGVVASSGGCVSPGAPAGLLLVEEDWLFEEELLALLEELNEDELLKLLLEDIPRDSPAKRGETVEKEAKTNPGQPQAPASPDAVGVG